MIRMFPTAVLAVVAALVLALPKPALASLQILEAVYGSDDGALDVTQTVKEAESGGRVEIVASNSTFGSDPAPGKAKSLRVTYRINGSLAEKTVGEGRTLMLPEKEDAPPAPLSEDASSAAPLYPLPAASRDQIKLLQEAAEASTVVIEFNISDRASGATGFVAEHEGQKYIVTNLHVLHGEAATEAHLIWYEGPRRNLSTPGRIPHLSRLKTSYKDFQKHLEKAPLPKVKSHTGEILRVGTSLLLSKSRDIALIPVETDLPALRIAQEAPRRDQDIFVVGNPEAEHTIIVLDGSITAMGPERIELSIRRGELKKGMSGGPVLSSETGEVLGAVAYKVERLENPDKKFSVEEIKIEGGPRISRVQANIQMVVRNFAFRLDNLNDLEPITWQQFLLDSGTFHAMGERTMNIAVATQAAFRYYGAEGAVAFDLPPDFDSAVGLSYRSALKSLSSARNPGDFERSWNSYQRSLESLLNQDMANPNFMVRTSYVKNLVQTEVAAERRAVSTQLRASSGRLPGRAER
jgi:hypothetical protein